MHILLPVYDRKALSYPNENGEGADATYAPLAEILTEPADFDAHFSCYSLPDLPYRLNKDVIQEQPVPITLLTFDVDDEAAHKAGTPARPEWYAAEAYKITALLMKHDAFIYHTRGGYRVVAGWLPEPFVITSPADASLWTALYKTHCRALKRRFGIECDERCADWQRQFRIPRACRDGVVQDLPTFGDPTTLGLWTGLEAIIDADVVDADDVRESKPRPGMRALTPECVALASAHALTLKPAVQGAGAENDLWAACNEILVGFDLDVASALAVIEHAYLPRCDVTKHGPEHFLERARKKLEELNESAEKPYGWRLDHAKTAAVVALAAPPSSGHKAKLSGELIKKDSTESIGGDTPRALDRIKRKDVAALLRDAFDPSIQRLATPFETLNKSTRGGFRRKDFILVTGKPGAGKTSFCMQLASHYLEQGVPVCVVAADEPIEGLLSRMGQRKGLARDDIERGAAHAVKRLEEICAEWRFLPLSSHWEGATLENAATALFEEHGPGVVIVDSAQRARTETSAEAESAKKRVDDIVMTIQQVNEKFGHITICTSEAVRGSYSSKDDAKNVEDIAASKESGGLEYGCTTMLMLKQSSEENVFTITTPKNRSGTRPKWAVKWDYVRATFSEVTALTEDEEAERQKTTHDTIKNDIISVIKTCSKAGKKLSSKNLVHVTMTTLGKRWRKAEVLNCMTMLESELKIAKVGGFYEAL